MATSMCDRRKSQIVSLGAGPSRLAEDAGAAAVSLLAAGLLHLDSAPSAGPRHAPV